MPYSEELMKIIFTLGKMFADMVAPLIDCEFFATKSHTERGTEGVCWYLRVTRHELDARPR